LCTIIDKLVHLFLGEHFGNLVDVVCSFLYSQFFYHVYLCLVLEFCYCVQRATPQDDSNYDYNHCKKIAITCGRKIISVAHRGHCCAHNIEPSNIDTNDLASINCAIFNSFYNNVQCLVWSQIALRNVVDPRIFEV